MAGPQELKLAAIKRAEENVVGWFVNGLCSVNTNDARHFSGEETYL